MSGPASGSPSSASSSSAIWRCAISGDSDHTVSDHFPHASRHAANSDGLDLVAREISFMQAEKLVLRHFLKPFAFSHHARRLWRAVNMHSEAIQIVGGRHPHR